MRYIYPRWGTHEWVERYYPRVRAPQYLAILINMPRYAAVDIGSNSIRMLAAESRQLLASRHKTGTAVMASKRISQNLINLSAIDLTFDCAVLDFRIVHQKEGLAENNREGKSALKRKIYLVF